MGELPIECDEYVGLELGVRALGARCLRLAFTRTQLTEVR